MVRHPRAGDLSLSELPSITIGEKKGDHIIIGNNGKYPSLKERGLP